MALSPGTGAGGGTGVLPSDWVDRHQGKRAAGGSAVGNAGQERERERRRRRGHSRRWRHRRSHERSGRLIARAHLPLGTVIGDGAAPPDVSVRAAWGRWAIRVGRGATRAGAGAGRGLSLSLRPTWSLRPARGGPEPRGRRSTPRRRPQRPAARTALRAPEPSAPASRAPEPAAVPPAALPRACRFVPADRPGTRPVTCTAPSGTPALPRSCAPRGGRSSRGARDRGDRRA